MFAVILGPVFSFLSCLSVSCNKNTLTVVLFSPVLETTKSKDQNKTSLSMTCCFLFQLETLYIPAWLPELVEELKARRKQVLRKIILILPAIKSLRKE